MKILIIEDKKDLAQSIAEYLSEESYLCEFAKNTKDLRQVIETETNKQTQLLANNQKAIKISIWIIGGLTLIMSILAVIKLWAA